jgi:taurine dioxygenase/sulfonate dioxygenase
MVSIDISQPKKFSATNNSTGAINYTSDIHFREGEDRIDEKSGIKKVSEKEYKTVDYPEWLPTWDPNEKYEAYSDDLNRSFSDRGFLADAQLRNLFPPEKKEEINITKLSPKLGSEVRGVQLSQLDDAAKNDLALFVAQRGVVVFRDQDLKDKGLEFNRQFGSYFGPLHIHPSSGAPENYPQFHIVYRRKDSQEYNKTFKDKLSVRGWHSDVTYEKYPPGTTFFTILQGPETGGDTIFSDTVEAYNRLSPTFQKIISGLKAVHTSERQAASSRAGGGIERRPPSTTLHPLVRIHPVTKQKSLYVPGFIEEIDGLKKEESEAILELLFNHVNHSHDLQIRARYEPGTVAVWDNRRVLHAGTFDWESGDIRHCYRITPMAERPVENEEELEEWNR